MYPTNQSQFLCFLVINFITKKFKIIVIGVGQAGHRHIYKARHEEREHAYPGHHSEGRAEGGRV